MTNRENKVLMNVLCFGCDTRDILFLEAERQLGHGIDHEVHDSEEFTRDVNSRLDSDLEAGNND